MIKLKGRELSMPGKYVTRKKFRKKMKRLESRVEKLETLHEWQLKEASDSGIKATHVKDEDLIKHIL